MKLFERIEGARRAYAAWREDAKVVCDVAKRGGAKRPALKAATDTSLWALTILRGGTALRSLTGSGFGARTALRLAFHIDVWSEDIGPGVRLPHPFNIVIGDGAQIGAGCTLMHNTTIQRGECTRIGDGAVLGTGAVVLAGADIGEGALVGALSLVRGTIPAETVAVGAPARVVRALRPGERTRPVPPEPEVIVADPAAQSPAAALDSTIPRVPAPHGTEAATKSAAKAAKGGALPN